MSQTASQRTASPLPNPERQWARPARTDSVDPADVERRIGATSAPLEVLSGGLANTNVRVGTHRVLRIYRRDWLAAGKEAALLQRTWVSFRVPAVLKTGEDFVLLEYVPHTPLNASAKQGAAVGKALAEIHQIRFVHAGLLDAELSVCTPFPDGFAAFRMYALSQFDQIAPELAGELRPAVTTFFATYGDTLSRLAQPVVLLHGDFKASNLHWTDPDELLVLDWEFAYAGPPLLDIGQLFRWDPPLLFVEAFAQSYREAGGVLPAEWQRWAGAFDLVNLIGLLAGVAPDSRRAMDLRHRIRRVLATFDSD